MIDKLINFDDVWIEAHKKGGLPVKVKDWNSDES